MNESGADAAIRAWAARRRLPEVHLERWLGMNPEDRRALLELAQSLNPRTGQFVTALVMLEEIGVREDQTIAQLLARAEIRRIQAANESAPGKARALLDTLRALRFPRMRAAFDQLKTGIASLRLPAGIRVVLPADLASDELRVELTAHGGDDLQRLVDAIVTHAAELRRLADQLGGADEV